MLVIPHDNQVIRHHALLGPVIEAIVTRRTVIIHRKDDAVQAAHNGQLPQELHIALGGLLIDVLEVDIDAVQIELDGLSDQIADQPLSGRGPGQNLLIGNAVLVGDILHQRPHLDVVLMAVVYISLACQRINVAVIILQEEPGGGNGGQTLGIRNGLQHLAVGVRVGHLMPCHIDGIILGNARVLGLGVIGRGGLLTLLAQVFIADVADEAI